MKMDDKMKVIVCGGLAIVLCLIGYSCGSNDNIEEVETEQRQEMQIEEQEELETQEVEEQEIQDENLNKQARNGEYKFEEENKTEDLELAKQLIESVAEKSMGDARYTVIINEENNTIMHIYHLDMANASQGVYTSQWDELVEISAETSFKGKEALESYGLTDVNYSYIIGDMDEDRYFVVTLNGNIVYNMKDELN